MALREIVGRPWDLGYVTTDPQYRGRVRLLVQEAGGDGDPANPNDMEYLRCDDSCLTFMQWVLGRGGLLTIEVNDDDPAGGFIESVSTYVKPEAMPEPDPGPEPPGPPGDLPPIDTPPADPGAPTDLPPL